MKKIFSNKIINIEGTDLYDGVFQFDVLNWNSPIIPFYKGDEDKVSLEIIFLSDLLEEKKNLEMLEKAQTKPACYSNVYSPKDELEIFSEIFNRAISENKRIHIVGISLKEEIEMLEEYYRTLGFFREEINCFNVDFSQVVVSASVKIENIMWRGSDYKRMGKEIFFNPPIRESGQVKAMFKGINRGVTAGIYLPHPNPLLKGEGIAQKSVEMFGKNISQDHQAFFQEQITSEKILPITLSKVLNYNLKNIGISGEIHTMEIQY